MNPILNTPSRTETHDSTTCTAGVDGQQCLMCQFAQNASQANSSLFGAEQGQKIDSSPPSASGIAIPAPDFEREWAQAPRGITRVTEFECAEYFYLRGVRAGELKSLIETTKTFRAMAGQRGLYRG